MADFDGDGYLDKSDLLSTLQCLCGEELTDEEVDLVTEKVQWEWFFVLLLGSEEMLEEVVD